MAEPLVLAGEAETAAGSADGIVDRVVFRNAETGYTVLRLRGERGRPGPTLVGALPPLSPGETVRAIGVWQDDPAWGRQLRVARLEVLGEADAAALAGYLGSGVVPGVGPGLAARIVGKFGERLPDIIAREPDRLREVGGVGRKLQARIVEGWQAARRERELMLFLHAHGLGAGRAKAIMDTYGEEAVVRLAADPYALARDVRGIGFHTADEFARRLGTDLAATSRRAAALEHVLRLAEAEGDCGLAKTALLERGGQLLGQAAGELEPALVAAVDNGTLIQTEAAGVTFVQTARLAMAETEVAARLLALASGPAPWAGIDPAAALAAAAQALGLELAASQSLAVTATLAAKVLVVTGGPGTGKTTLVRAILAGLGAGGLEVVLCAPTGRAAKRLAESTGREARTIHRLLEADPRRGFRRGRSRPLAADLVVCDESSMVDIVLLRALLAAMPDEAGLILVGDVDQLPSVGPGQILADIIAAGTVPVIRLTEIFRQAAASAIVVNAHAINRGIVPQFEHRGDALGDFYGVRAERADEALEKVVELVAERIPERFGLDPLADLQVLVPTNRGAVGTATLNLALANRLNPAPGGVLQRGDRRWALGDKVMQIENDYEREVYNGDIGRITALDERAQTLVVRIDERDIAYGSAELDQLVPAYAVTVHKAQGSEYPAVILVLMRQHGRMLRRRLFYTAITRAKRLVVVVAEPSAVDRAVRDVGERPRLTLLRHRLEVLA